MFNLQSHELLLGFLLPPFLGHAFPSQPVYLIINFFLLPLIYNLSAPKRFNFFKLVTFAQLSE